MKKSISDLKHNDIVSYDGQNKRFDYSQYQKNNVDVILYFADGTHSKAMSDMASVEYVEKENREQYQERMVHIAIDELGRYQMQIGTLIENLRTLQKDIQRTQDRIVGVLPPLQESDQA